MPDISWQQLRAELKGKVGLSGWPYYLPSRRNTRFFEIAANRRLRLKAIIEADPARLEIAYFFVGEIKRQKGLKVEPGDDELIIPSMAERFPPFPNVEKRITQSWLCEFLTESSAKGDDFDYHKTAYYQFLKSLENIGLARPKKFYTQRCLGFLELLKRIDRVGYRSERLMDLVMVMETPLATTRHNHPPFNNYYEIYTGHHRTAVAAYLGLPKIPVAVMVDAASEYEPPVQTGSDWRAG